jgi:DNA primase catalytic core
VKGSFEYKLSDAEKVVIAFFDLELELAEKFMEAAAHMIELENDVLIRCNSSIIGVAKPGERYRFYVSNNGKEFLIKYKNETSAKSFQKALIEDLYECNNRCCKFFQETDQHIDAKDVVSESGESLGRHVIALGESYLVKAEVKAQWQPVMLHAEKAIDSVKQKTDKVFLQAIYNKVSEIFWHVAVNALDSRDSKIIISRFLKENTVTLQALGDQINLSGERVRQLAEKRWKMICHGIHRGADEVYSFYRQELCKLLVGIDESLFIQCVAYIAHMNPSVGEFLIRVTTPAYRPEAYNCEISKYQFGNTKKVSMSERIPQEIVSAVHNIEIAKHIGLTQMLERKGEVYRGVCPTCGVQAITVYPKNNSYYCFSCKTGGDIITYERAKGHTDYKTAVLSLAEMYDIKLEEKIIPRKEIMKSAAHFYHQQLRANPENQKAIDVLHSWGLFGKTIVNLGIGFNDNKIASACNYLSKEKKIPYSSLIRYYLVGKTDKSTYYDRMRNSIIIPTVSLSGNVECFDYYNLEKNEFMYYLSSEDFVRKQNIYSLNIAVASKKKSVVVVSNYEAYFALLSSGITNSVSIYMSQMSESQMLMLKKHFKVIILMTEGFANVSECRKFCQKNNMYCDNISLGQDSAVEYIKSNADKIAEKIDYYESVFTLS